MKSKTITAIVIAVALVIFSAVLLYNKKTSIPEVPNITGVWHLDTLYATQPVADSIQNLVHAMASPGEAETYTFKTDSILIRQSSKDSISEKYYMEKDVLYIDNGYGYLPYRLRSRTDSLLAFINRDSVVFVLEKK